MICICEDEIYVSKYIYMYGSIVELFHPRSFLNSLPTLFCCFCCNSRIYGTEQQTIKHIQSQSLVPLVSYVLCLFLALTKFCLLRRPKTLKYGSSLYFLLYTAKYQVTLAKGRCYHILID